MDIPDPVHSAVNLLHVEIIVSESGIICHQYLSVHSLSSEKLKIEANKSFD